MAMLKGNTSSVYDKCEISGVRNAAKVAEISALTL